MHVCARRVHVRVRLVCVPVCVCTSMRVPVCVRRVCVSVCVYQCACVGVRVSVCVCQCACGVY